MTLVLPYCSCSLKPKPRRIGILSGFDYFANTTVGFKEKLAELGWIEERNIQYDIQSSSIDSLHYRNILAQFIADKVDLIFVFPTEASLEAKAAAGKSGIPVLFANATIEETGLVKSVAHPGGKITGVRWPGPDMAVKILEIMRQIAPDAKRFWLPFQKGYPTITSQLSVLHSAATAAGITLVEYPADDASDLKKALREYESEKDLGIDAIINIAEPLCGVPDAFSAMCTFAQSHNLPIGGSLVITPECEALFSVNVDHLEVGKKAAILANNILSGVPADSLHVVSAEPYIQINYREIVERGFIAEEGLLSSANEIIR